MTNYRNKEVKLVNKITGEEVKVGDEVTCFRGSKRIVKYMRPPHKPSSSGYVNDSYAGVFNCEFIEL